MPPRLPERAGSRWHEVGNEDVAALVRRAVIGDRDAAAVVLTELAPRARNLVRYLVRRDRDVDDIAQDALVAILRGLAGYRADGSLTSWADRIVVRTTFAWLRRARVEPPLFAVGREAVSDLEAAHVAPDDYVMRRWAVGVLDGLPQEQRHAVVLHYLLDLSVPEVAVEVGVPLETVRSRLRLARVRLRARGVEVEPAPRRTPVEEPAGGAR